MVGETGGETAVDDPDRAILAQVAAGDGEAFGRLVRAHQDHIFRVCARLLGDREEARDAAQETFVKAFKSAHRFEPQARVSTWLYRIAVNHCLNLLRRRQIVRFFSLGELGGARDDEGGGAELDLVSEAPGPEEVVSARRRWRTTQRAIAALPPNQRAVVTLVRLEGLSYREAAETLGITEGAVESRLFRAMQRLEKALR